MEDGSMNVKEYLFDSITQFFKCNLWRGTAAHKSPTKLRNWFGWVYIASFNGYTSDQVQIEDHCQDLRFKIGYTYDLMQRGASLKRENRKTKVTGDPTPINEDREEETDQQSTKKNRKPKKKN